MVVAGLQLWGFRSRYLRTSAGKVHVLDARGSGDLAPFVLIHGLSSCGADFAPLLFRLRRQSRRVIAIDLPGHGLSGPLPTDSATLHDGVREALGEVVDEPHFVFGNSLGGLAAIRYVLARQDRVAGLVLASPAGAAMDEAELRAMVADLRVTNLADARRFMDRVLSRPGLMKNVYAVGAVNRFWRVRDVFDRARPDDLLTPADIGALRVPVLVLWGKDDRILPDAHRAFFRRNLPAHAHFEEPVGFGHAPSLDDPAGLARRITAFARAA